MNSLRVLFCMIWYKYKGALQYRFDFVTWTIIKILYYSLSYVSVCILVQKFQRIAGWDMYELFVLISLSTLSYVLSAQFFYVLHDTIESEIQSGGFDRCLLVPVTPMVYLVGKGWGAEYWSQIVLAGLVLHYCLGRFSIDWSVGNVVAFAGVVIGGAAIQGAAFLASASTAFWSVRSSGLMGLLFRLRSFVDYPISIYPMQLRFVLTFVIPYAFINYYPMVYLLGKATPSHPLVPFMSPIIGGLAFALAHRLWNRALNAYQGTGS
jgi:ABC-2 type transport system permease protein